MELTFLAWGKQNKQAQKLIRTKPWKVFLEKKNGGNCKGSIRNIRQSFDNTQTPPSFFFPFGFLYCFSSGLINKKSRGLTEEIDKESDQLGGSVHPAETPPVQNKGKRGKAKSWATEPVLDLQVTLRTFQITLFLLLDSQRAMYLHKPYLLFTKKKKKESIFTGYHKSFVCQSRG